MGEMENTFDGLKLIHNPCYECVVNFLIIVSNHSVSEPFNIAAHVHGGPRSLCPQIPVWAILFGKSVYNTTSQRVKICIQCPQKYSIGFLKKNIAWVEGGMANKFVIVTLIQYTCSEYLVIFLELLTF